MDARSVAAVERQAAEVGTRVGKAISDNASRSMSSTLATNLARQISKLENDVSRARKTTQDASEQLRIAEERLNEARAAGLTSGSRLLSLERAVEVQRRRMSEASRIEAEALASIPALRQRLADEELRIAEETGRKLAAQRARANAAEVKAEVETAKRIAAEEAKIRDKAMEAEIRGAERAARERAKIEIDSVNKLVKAHNDALKRVEKLRIQVEIDERQAIEAGRHQGGLIARSVRHEIHQNAGLIAAVIGGALLLGAPVLLGAATVLFAGVGAVAAAQSQRVRSAWVGAWDEIRTSAIADAAVLVPTFERMSVSIAQSFQRMRPLIRDAFEAVGPQIDAFTASLTRTAENALPGLVRAVQAGGPVIAGLGQMLETVGSGFSDFFDRLRTVAPQAGQAFSQFGDLLAQALPLLAEMLAVGVQVANAVFPALTGSLRGVLAVLEAVDGVLPTVLTGFLAFRVVQGVGRYLSTFAASLGMASIQGGLFAGTAGRAAGVVSTLGRALPGIGVAVGVVGALMARSEQQISSWSQAMLQGGQASSQALQEMANPGLWDRFLFNLTHWFNTEDVGERQVRETTEAMNKQLAAMDPLTRARTLQTQASNDLAAAMQGEGRYAGDVAGAQANLAAKTADTERIQAQLERAMRGVTEAMVEQANQARALADSSFAYENALNDLEDAQEDYNKALADGNEEEKSRALLALQESYNDVANAARDVANDALPAMMNEQQKAIIADKAQLDALLALKAQYGDLGPILENQVRELTAATTGANANALAQAQLVAALGQVGIAAEAIPDTKSVKVEALTDSAITRLEELGFRVVEMPDGSFEVVALTEEAEKNLAVIDTELLNLDGTVVEPQALLNSQQLQSGYMQSMRDLGTLHSQKPTPTANMNSTPFRSVYDASIRAVENLASQRPTPQALLNSQQLQSGYMQSMGSMNTLGAQRPTPQAHLVDGVSGIARAAAAAINAIQSRTVTVNINTVYRTYGTPAGGAPLSVAAPNRRDGGEIPHYRAGIQKLDFGGAVRFSGAIFGRGGPRDDLVPTWTSPGEHVWDTRDVAMTGGQSAVYALRDLINTGKLGQSPVDTIRQMVDFGDNARKSSGGDAGVIAGFVNNGRIELRDEGQFYRQAEQARREILTSVLG